MNPWTWAAGLAAGLTAEAIRRRETDTVGVTHWDVPLPGWPPCLDGFRAVVVSDLHIHPERTTIRRREVRLAEVLASLECDVLLAPGDMCNTAEAARIAVDVLRHCSPRYGRFLTLGNGEHKRVCETDPAIATLRLAGRVLMNEAEVIQVGGSPVCILGVDDPSRDYDRLHLAARWAPEGVPRILLAHSPEIVTRLHTAAVDLVVCGHTHGGQVCPPSGKALWTQTQALRRSSLAYGVFGPADFAPYNPHDLSHVRMFVSRGVGTAKLAVRVNCRPEVAVLTLRSEASGQ